MNQKHEDKNKEEKSFNRNSYFEKFDQVFCNFISVSNRFKKPE